MTGLLVLLMVFIVLLLLFVCCNDSVASSRYICYSCHRRIFPSNDYHSHGYSIQAIILPDSMSETRACLPNQRVLDLYGQHYLNLNRNMATNENYHNQSEAPPNYNSTTFLMS